MAIDKKKREHEQVMIEFGQLLRGAVGVEELDSERFGRSPDGTPRLIVDHATFLALNGASGV